MSGVWCLLFQRHISKSLGLSLSRNKLEQQGLLLLHTDLAMLREGFDSMTDEELERVSQMTVDIFNTILPAIYRKSC